MGLISRLFYHAFSPFMTLYNNTFLTNAIIWTLKHLNILCIFILIASLEQMKRVKLNISVFKANLNNAIRVFLF